MLRFSPSLLGLALLACGSDQAQSDDSSGPGSYTFDDAESYYDALAEKICSYWEPCGQTGPCPYLDEDWTETTTTSFESCVFNEDRATECLATEFTCTNGTGSEFLCFPRMCARVHDCGTTPPATDTGCL